MKIEKMKDKVEKLWKSTRKDLEKVVKETNILIKKGEGYIKDISEKGKEKLETMGLILRKEKLYYELGRTLASLAKSKWIKDKKVGKLVEDIKKINREIKSKKIQ